MMNQISPPELQFKKSNASGTEVPFLHLYISNGFVSSKIYGKRDDVSRFTSYGVYVSQLIQFTKVMVIRLTSMPKMKF